MKKAFLLSISLFFTYSIHAMGFNSESPQQRWEKLITSNPEAKYQIDRFLKEEVAKYHPGFTNWRWQEASGRARGEWSADTVTRTIKIPYPDLLFLNDYIMGKIPKQAILSRLAILHHEITHMIKKHASVYHPSRIALANVFAAQGSPASQERKQYLAETASQEMLKTEWEADYGVPNIPNMMQALSSFMRSRPSPQPAGPLDITKHPHPLARAAAAEDRYAKLKVGKQISSGKLSFEQNTKPNIQGSSPIKAAQMLGIEDPYYYSSLTEEEHPFEITLVQNDHTKITLPYHVAMYANSIYDYMQEHPSKAAEYPINIQNLIDSTIILTRADLILLKDVLTHIEQSFQQGMITQEATYALLSFLIGKGSYMVAHLAGLADIFKIPLIIDAIELYYKQFALPEPLAQDKRTFETISQQPEASVLQYGAKRILTFI